MKFYASIDFKVFVCVIIGYDLTGLYFNYLFFASKMSKKLT